MSPLCRKLPWAVLLAAAVCALPHPATAAPPREPDYRGQVCRYVPIPLAGKRPNFVDRIAQGPLRGFCEETAVAARLWQWTGRAEYAEEACQRLTALLDVWELQHQPGKPWKRVCFFSACPIIDAYRLLRSGGQLDAEFQRRFRGFAREAYFAQEEGTFNQAFARAAGLAWAAKTLPELPEAASWRKSAEAVWNQWRRQGDMNENAAAYNGIALTYLFLLADALDHNDQLQEPRLRAMFDRFRDQVSPWGAMPEYGDSGDAEWGMFHAWGTWVCALERAGALYHDAGYRWAAVRMFQAACQRSSSCPGRHDLGLRAVPGRSMARRPLDAAPPRRRQRREHAPRAGRRRGRRQAAAGPLAATRRALRHGRTLRPRLPCPRRSTGGPPLLRIPGRAAVARSGVS